MKNIKNITIIILLFLLFILMLRVYFLRVDYLRLINNKIITQELYGVKYKTIASNNSSYKIIIGDILGIDRKSYNFVDNLEPRSDNPTLLIPGIKKEYNKITTNNFLQLIANKNNVFIPDNFCTKDWPNNINNDLYKNSNLTRGEFCSSEDEVALIDRLIKQYNPSLIEIYYSSDTYRELLRGFLLYLDDLNIKYKLIEVQ